MAEKTVECLPGEHKFEGRYDRRTPNVVDSFFLRGDEEKNKIYVRDVCVLCGKTIERK